MAAVTVFSKKPSPLQVQRAVALLSEAKSIDTFSRFCASPAMRAPQFCPTIANGNAPDQKIYNCLRALADPKV